MGKEALLLETKKQVMQFKLKIKEQLESINKDQLLAKRTQRRQQQSSVQQDGELDYKHETSFAYSEGEYPLSGDEEEDPHYRDDFDRRDAGGMQM